MEARLHAQYLHFTMMRITTGKRGTQSRPQPIFPQCLICKKQQIHITVEICVSGPPNNSDIFAMSRKKSVGDCIYFPHTARKAKEQQFACVRCWPHATDKCSEQIASRQLGNSCLPAELFLFAHSVSSPPAPHCPRRSPLGRHDGLSGGFSSSHIINGSQ